MAIVAVLAVVAFIVIAALGVTTFGGFFGFPMGAFPFFICLPVLFVVFAIIFGLYQSGARRRTIPPPPPIQQPMVPAGQQGPVAVDCPNCGGPPTNVDRFGIATCSYCGTRFLVR
jgi:hypothetical protein